MQRWRVPLGFLVAACFLLFAHPTLFSLAVGGAVALVGLLIRAWASGHIRKNDKLAVTGPYAFTRNPLYFGSFILGLGFTIAAGLSGGRWLLAVSFAALFAGIYLPVMRVEANTLLELFGDEYRAYAAAVPLFLPRLTPYKAHADEKMKPRFDLGLYLRYREYRAAFGLVAALGLLVVKALVWK